MGDIRCYERKKEKFGVALLRDLAGLLAVAWMCVIFAFSAQPKEESGAVSESFTYQMVSKTNRLFHIDWDDARVREIAASIEGGVRKAAHMVEYGILAALIYGWLGRWAFPFLQRGGRAFLTAAIYAATDEFHQLFVPGRSGRVTDVLIDSAGGLLGVLTFVVVAWISKLREKRIEKRVEKRLEEKFEKRGEEKSGKRTEEGIEESAQEGAADVQEPQNADARE